MTNNINVQIIEPPLNNLIIETQIGSEPINVSVVSYSGTNISITHDLPVLPSDINDNVASLLVAGSGIQIDYNNNIPSITISSSGASLNSEQVQDIVSNLIQGSGYVLVNYNDSANSLIISVSGLQPSGNYANTNHSHLSSDISNFNSSVSGLLPVKNISSGSGISVVSNNADFTISVTGTFGLTSEQVDDRVNNLLKSGSYINLSYDDNLDSLTINVTGLQPSGNYSLVGHTHTISDVSGLQNALDNKQPSGIYASGVHSHVVSDITDFNSAVSGLIPQAQIFSTGTIDLHNGGIQNAQILQFNDPNLQSVITGPVPISGNSSQRIIIQGQRGQGNGEGGDVYLWGGDSDINGGDIKIYAGDADSSESGNGGYVNIDGGNGYDHGGQVNISAGNSTIEGGDIIITAGYPSGLVRLRTNGSSPEWIFNPDSTVQLPNNTLDAGSNSIDIKSSFYSELWYESGPSGNPYNWIDNSSYNSSSYIWTAFDGSFIQNVRSNDGFNPSWNYTWLFANNGETKLPEGKPLNFGQNLDTLGPPVAGGGTDRVRLWDFEGEGSNFNYAIGAEGNHVWFSMDVNDGTGGFKFYSRDNEIFKISDDSKLVFPNNTTLAQGTFDNGTGGNSGISLNCYVGYELNWQGGHLISTQDNGATASTIFVDSPIEFPGSGIDNIRIDNSGIRFSDNTIQITAWTGSVSYENVTGLGSAALSSSGDFAQANHNHSSADITDFNSSVSGLLPNISGNGYIISSFDNNTYTISATGLQPSGIYASGIHYHNSSDITDFNSSVSGLLNVKDMVSGTGIYISSNSGIYTINSTVSGVAEAASIVTNVFNKTASTINKGSVVYINGGQGDQPTIQLAIANGETGSSKTYGIVQNNISSMSAGKVVVAGALTGFDTDQYNPTSPHGDINGTTLWLSPSVSGGITTTKPSAPNHTVSVGTVVRTHQNEGVIEVKIQNGFELQELHNVAINGVTNGQFLQYNSSSGLWMPTSSGNFTSLSVNGTGISLAGHTHSSSSITDFNSSVSGLLPVTNILGGSNIGVTQSGTVYTVAVTGSLGLTTEEVDDRVASLLVAGTGINLNYNDSGNTLTISTTKNTILSDVVSSTNYIGIAPTGTLTSSSSWKIKKTVYASGGTISSTGTALNVAWNDRLTASYS